MFKQMFQVGSLQMQLEEISNHPVGVPKVELQQAITTTKPDLEDNCIISMFKIINTFSGYKVLTQIETPIHSL